MDAMQENLLKYPTIQITVDVHRDAFGEEDDGTRYKPDVYKRQILLCSIINSPSCGISQRRKPRCLSLIHIWSRGIGVRADALFHPDHVVPAAECIAAVFERADRFVAEVGVKIGTVVVLSLIHIFECNPAASL